MISAPDAAAKEPGMKREDTEKSRIVEEGTDNEGSNVMD
jgi:hypothetical protein